MFTVFENNGHLPIEAITTLGVSVKTEGAIGYFGTGLKYAIAVLIRNDYTVLIKSEGNIYKFAKENKSVKGTIFDFITLQKNNETPRELGFTTDLGKNWGIKEAYREIYCNCKDEQGEVRFLPLLENSLQTAIKKIKEINKDTVIAVWHNENERGMEFNLSHNEMILSGNPLAESRDLQLFPQKTKPSIFYKGINAYSLNTPTLYSYNIKSNLSLTEDRTIKYSWAALGLIEDGIVTLQDENILEHILSSQTTIEKDFNFDNFYDTLTRLPIEVLENYKKTHPFIKTIFKLYKARILRNSLKRFIYLYDKKEIEFVPEESYTLIVKECINLLKLNHYNIDRYPIKFVSSLNKNVLGQAKDGTIYLTDVVLKGGKMEILRTLLEEYFHLESGFDDMTREFQNFIFLEFAFTLSKFEVSFKTH